MKKIKIILLIAVIAFANMRCTEKENTIDQHVNMDSIAIKAIAKKEKKDTTKRYVYLTIDDVPGNGSAYVDSIILSQKVKTNLFLVGHDVDGSKRFLKYYEAFRKNPHVEIYNHSYTHANNRYAAYYKNPESVLNDFEKNRTNFNITHKIARLPGRNLWLIGEQKKNCRQTGSSSAELLAKNGYKIFGWDVEWKYNFKNYTPKQNVDELVKEIENLCNTSNTFTRKQIVLLVHNQMFRKVNEKNNLRELIEKLKEKEFSFEYLSSYTSLSSD